MSSQQENDELALLLTPILHLDTLDQSLSKIAPFLDPTLSIKERILDFISAVEKIAKQRNALDDKFALSVTTYAIGAFRDVEAFDRVYANLESRMSQQFKASFLPLLQGLKAFYTGSEEIALSQFRSTKTNETQFKQDLNAISHLYQSYCLRIYDKLDQSLEAANQGLSLDGISRITKISLLGNLGACHYLNRRYTDAETAYSEASTISADVGMNHLSYEFAVMAWKCNRHFLQEPKPEYKPAPVGNGNLAIKPFSGLLKHPLEQTISTLLSRLTKPENQQQWSSVPNSISVELDALARAYRFYGLELKAIDAEKTRSRCVYMLGHANLLERGMHQALESSILSGDSSLAKEIVRNPETNPLSEANGRTEFINWYNALFSIEVPPHSACHLTALSVLPMIAEYFSESQARSLAQSLMKLSKRSTSLLTNDDWGRPVTSALISLLKLFPAIADNISLIPENTQSETDILWIENLLEESTKLDVRKFSIAENDRLWAVLKSALSVKSRHTTLTNYYLLSKLFNERAKRDPSASHFISEFSEKHAYTNLLTVYLCATDSFKFLTEATKLGLESKVLDELRGLLPLNSQLRRTDGMSLAAFDNLNILLNSRLGLREQAKAELWSIVTLLLNDASLPLEKQLTIWRQICTLVSQKNTIPEEVIRSLEKSISFTTSENLLSDRRPRPSPLPLYLKPNGIEIWATAMRVSLFLPNTNFVAIYNSLIRATVMSDLLEEQEPLFWLMRDLIHSEAFSKQCDLLPVIVRLAYSKSTRAREMCAALLVGGMFERRSEETLVAELARRLVRDRASPVRSTLAKNLMHVKNLSANKDLVNELLSILSKDASVIVRNSINENKDSILETDD